MSNTTNFDNLGLAGDLAVGGSLTGALSAVADYDKEVAGVQTLLAAAGIDRAVLIHVRATEAFADGDGAQTTFAVGETDTADKFAATGKFTGAALNADFVFGGHLTAGKALIVTATAATGTGTGAIRVTAQPLPIADVAA